MTTQLRAEPAKQTKRCVIDGNREEIKHVFERAYGNSYWTLKTDLPPPAFKELLKRAPLHFRQWIIHSHKN
jgi:hypothetical protein